MEPFTVPPSVLTEALARTPPTFFFLRCVAAVRAFNSRGVRFFTAELRPARLLFVAAVIRRLAGFLRYALATLTARSKGVTPAVERNPLEVTTAGATTPR